MSICAIADRKILSNITNMEDRGDEETDEMTPSDNNEVREAKGVKADSTPPAASPMVLHSSEIGTRSIGEEIHRSRRLGNAAARKDCLRSTHGCWGKFGRGNGSGIQRKKEPPEECADNCAAKKRKTRRGKPKHRKLKPFARQRCRAIGRMTKTGGQPPAPYNTTQFLMEDHSDLPDLDQKLADAITCEVPPSFQKPLAPPRTRDSSFSIDSDEDYFYSSPENEEEFLTKEFSSAYEDLHAERLNAMTKSELIQEYVQLEAKLDMLTKRLRSKNLQPVEDRETDGKTRWTSGSGTPATASTPTNNDADVAKKLKACQQRMEDLSKQNEQLRRDNEALRAKDRASPVSSVDSESDSDSDSTSNGNRSSCGCSVASAESPAPGKSYRARRDKDRPARAKRCSSVDSESDGPDATSGKNDSCTPSDDSPDSLGNDLVNRNTTNHQMGVLPT